MNVLLNEYTVGICSCQNLVRKIGTQLKFYHDSITTRKRLICGQGRQGVELEETITWHRTRDE